MTAEAQRQEELRQDPNYSVMSQTVNILNLYIMTITFIFKSFLLHLFVFVQVRAYHVCHSGQLAEVSSRLPPFRFQGQNSGCHLNSKPPYPLRHPVVTSFSFLDSWVSLTTLPRLTTNFWAHNYAPSLAF